MGTVWSVAFAAPGLRAAVARAEIESKLAALVNELSQWEPSSALSRFNRAPAGSWHDLPPDFATVIAAGLEIAAISDGAFDPAIGHIATLYGFGPAGLQPQPDAASITAAHRAGGAHRLAYDPGMRRLRQPGGLALDFSGIGKGHAVDALGATLARLGVRDWLVEIGGELKGAGMRPDGDPWWVDCESPPEIALRALRIALHGLAIATSGDYRRGRHTIDPRTGLPIDNGIVSVSAIHERAMIADAWATTLTVLGPENGLILADAHGIAARIVVRGPRGVAEHLSRALRAMLDEGDH